ncbi:BON domain-containing protein [Paraburkholderia sp. BCC1885]|jgi:osmotically-inducible protein OsmY|uniref:BON domain-containing protein n=1 Tax=Paraburkholderia sp. BCC1885 TaxID=2562669 RepID=UPI001183141F|nr:BON domain-containing protein [Paraburkholderia sp. BCC1885]
MRTVGILSALCLTVAVALPVAAYAQASDAMAGMDNGSTASGKKAASRSDRALARSVRRALTKTPGFNVSNVFVRARSGAVTLSGSVDSGDQISQAEQVAHTVPGVTSVSNKLTLFHGGNG